MMPASHARQRSSRANLWQQSASLDATHGLVVESNEEALTLQTYAKGTGHATAADREFFVDQLRLTQTFSDHDPLDIAKTFRRFSSSTCTGQRQPALGMASADLALALPDACAVPEGNVASDNHAFLRHTLAGCGEERQPRPERDGAEQLVQSGLPSVRGVACLCFPRAVDCHWIDRMPTLNKVERSLAIFERGIDRDGASFAAGKQKKKGR